MNRIKIIKFEEKIDYSFIKLSYYFLQIFSLKTH